MASKYNPQDIINGFTLIETIETKRRGTWKVLCACGEHLIARPSDLKRKKGCSTCIGRHLSQIRRKYNPGDKLGVFTVLNYQERGKGILCLCPCGQQTSIKPHNVEKRVGCSACAKGRKRPDLVLPNNQAAKNKSLRTYKKSASVRGYDFNLSDQQAFDLFSSNCFYCDSSPSPVNGIDRVDNTQGYTFLNCVSCCSVCNLAKRELTKDEFLAWIKRVHDKWFNDYPEREYTQVGGSAKHPKMDEDIV